MIPEEAIAKNLLQLRSVKWMKRHISQNCKKDIYKIDCMTGGSYE
jgi:hypothetical protein